MSLFSRIFVILICLALAAGAIAIVVLAWTIPLRSIDGLRVAVDWLEEHNQDTEKALLTAIGAVLGLLALIVVVLELLPRIGTAVKVTDLKVGDAVLSTTSIAQRVEETVQRVPHVAAVRAVVKAKRKGVQVALDLHVDPEANLATVTDEACAAAQDVLINRVHVALLEPPHARLHYRELRLRQRPPVAPTPQEAPVAPSAPSPTSAPVAPVRQLSDPSVPAPHSSSAGEAAVALAEPEAAGDNGHEERPAE